jgi:hypothetical protein
MQDPGGTEVDSQRYAQRLKLPSPPPFDALWSYRRRAPTDLNAVKAARAAMIWRACRGRARLALLARYLGWAFRFQREVVRSVRRHGADARRLYGRSHSRQIADIIRIAARNGVSPRGYYFAGLPRYQGNDDLFRYLPPNLPSTVINQLTLRRNRENFALARDKLAFERRCLELGLPVVRTIAIATDATLLEPSGDPFLDQLPPRDLILKPIRGHQGNGVELWRYRVGVFTRDGECLSAAELAHRAGILATKARLSILVQERAVNHPALQSLAGSALATTRLTTALNEKGTPEIVDAFYRTSAEADAPVDNFHAGGALFPIELPSGRFAPGMLDKRWQSQGITHHPQTHTQMVGVVHPGWDAVRDLALALHAALPDFIVVGWDIGFTPAGPIVTEANVPPGVSLNRQSTFGGVVGTRFLQLVAFHCRAWLNANEPADSRWRPAGPGA